jgi:hypothetical protein
VDIADGLEEASLIEPVHPFKGGKFNGLKRPPWSSAMKDLGLVEVIDRLSHGVIVAVADAADRGLKSSQPQSNYEIGCQPQFLSFKLI